jgi:hypothetical protein
MLFRRPSSHSRRTSQQYAESNVWPAGTNHLPTLNPLDVKESDDHAPDFGLHLTIQTPEYGS